MRPSRHVAGAISGDAVEILGLSRCSATGVIPTIRIGKRLIVPRIGLERLLTGTAGA